MYKYISSRSLDESAFFKKVVFCLPLKDSKGTFGVKSLFQLSAKSLSVWPPFINESISYISQSMVKQFELDSKEVDSRLVSLEIDQKQKLCYDILIPFYRASNYDDYVIASLRGPRKNFEFMDYPHLPYQVKQSIWKSFFLEKKPMQDAFFESCIIAAEISITNSDEDEDAIKTKWASLDPLEKVRAYLSFSDSVSCFYNNLPAAIEDEYNLKTTGFGMG